MGRWLLIIVVLAWIVCMWCIIIYAMIRGWGPYVRSKLQEPRRVRARIANKLGVKDVEPLEMRLEYIHKALVFECEDSVEREFEVHDDIWDWVEVGDTGNLVYQGHLFIDFEPDRPRTDPDKLLKRLVRG